MSTSFYDHPSSQHTDTPPPQAGGGEQREAAQREPEKSEEQKTAELFFGETKPEEKREQQDDAPKDDPDAALRSLYGDTMYTEAETALLPDDLANATAEQLAEARADYREALTVLELPTGLANDVTQRFTAAMRAPMDDATYDKRVAAFPENLARRFGDEAKERLADVQKLLAKAHPAVVDALVESGLNYDIDVVAALADHARSLKGRGRL